MGSAIRRSTVNRTSPARGMAPVCPADADRAGGFSYEDFGKVFDGPGQRPARGALRRRDLGADALAWDSDARARAGVGGRARRRESRRRFASPRLSRRSWTCATRSSRRARGDDGPIWSVFKNRGMGYFASTDGSSDIAPIADQSSPPASPATTTLSGTVRDDDGQPLDGARVGIAGHDTQGRGALGPTLADETDRERRVRDRGAGWHLYPLVIARPPASVSPRARTSHVPASLRRLHARARLVLARQRGLRRALQHAGQHRVGCGPAG